MEDRPWYMSLSPRLPMEPEERDRLLEKAGIASMSSSHTTEEEVRAAAEEALQQLRAVTDTQWQARYFENYTPGTPGKPSYYSRTTVLRTSALDAEDLT